ncbi:MAG TPA: ABC transporter permease [Nakamurella sp.]|nr:ABC transporter permease [Nakamurella sp.]
MSTTSASAGPGTGAAGGSVRRMGSLARAEALLLRRNPVALLNAFVGPLAAVLLLGALPRTGADPESGAGIVATMTAVTLLSVVYYNLVTALVARREELVLKRLRSGQLGDAEILAGAAAPGIAIAWMQVVVAVAAGFLVFGMGAPVNPVLVLTGVLAGTAVFVLLAAASTAMTRSVEMAQISTMPVVIVSLVLGGLPFPLDVWPEPLQVLARLLPMTRVTELVQLGLTGTTTAGNSVAGLATFGEAAPALLVLVLWIVLGFLGYRRWMRWEPRR